MAEPIRVGVVGLGYFGGHHARHYAANPRARLTAIADVDGARAETAAGAHGAAAFTDHRALIGKVDAVSITAPTSLHHAIAGDFIDAGIPVFIEKPIAADSAAAADLVDRAAARGVLIQVGHIERFSPVFRRLAEETRQPLLIECARRTAWRGRAADVDVVLDLMIHDIDLALTIAGAPVVSADASGVPVVTRTSDVAEARLVFANGVTAVLAASRIAARPERTLAVTEADRQLHADLAGGALTVTTTSEDGAVHSAALAVPPADNLAAEIADFLACVAERRAPRVDGQAGLDALKVADMILAAIAAGRGTGGATHNGARS
jgi:predicted dehydrogenase